MSWLKTYSAQEGAGYDKQSLTQSISCLNAVSRDKGHNTIVLLMTDVVFNPNAKQKTALERQVPQPSHVSQVTSKGVSVQN